MGLKTEDVSFLSIGLDGDKGPMIGKRVMTGEFLKQGPEWMWHWLALQVGAGVAHHYRDAVLHTVGVMVTGIPASLARAVLAWLPADPKEAEWRCRKWLWYPLVPHPGTGKEGRRG